MIGTARLWHVATESGHAVLLLGPVAVTADCRSRGVGGALVRRAVAEAAKRGHGAVMLVGDAPYYSRFGFSTARTGTLWMPGPFERTRLLARELTPHALDGAFGLIHAAGALMPELALAADAIARQAGKQRPRAA